MIPHGELVARLLERAARNRESGWNSDQNDADVMEAAASALAALPPPADDQTMSDAATLRGYIRTRGETPAMTWSSREHWKARAEQAEAARQADPPHDCEAWRLEGLGCARCNKADPPALVALVRRFKEADARFMNALASGAWLDDAHDDLSAVRDELLSYPLPAAPPVPLATPTHVEIDHDGDLCLDFDRANNRVVSLTIYQDGRVGYSALVDGKSAHGIVTASEPMPSWVRDAIAAPPVPETPQGWPDGNNPVRWKPRPDCVEALTSSMRESASERADREQRAKGER